MKTDVNNTNPKSVVSRENPIKMSGIIALLQDITDLKQEHFVCITLDSAYQFITKRVVFIGTLNSISIHPREIFAGALEDRAAAIIVAHNHPSGNITPSLADKAATAQLVDGGELLGVPVYDHVIITQNNFFSFRERGMIPAVNLSIVE